MAKKRKSNQRRPQAQQQTGERIIGELFGSLEEEPDIEADVAELGVDSDAGEEKAPAEKPKRKRFFFVFAVFVIIMAIIGCISTIRTAVQITARLVDNTALKQELAQFIFPVVVNDIAPFESASDIPNSSKVTCAVWNILINKDTKNYEASMGGLTIPEYDVMASCKEIFGSSAMLEHQTVGTAEVRFTYDEENHVYYANKNIRYLTYAPYIVSMDESDNGTFKLIVGYLPPTVATVSGLTGVEASPEKYMEYTINRWDGKTTLLAVAFSDYKPETD
ncbi:MAG: hypothetical protein ACI4KM_10230 [Oscillospiraceae bacterium]